MSAVLMDELLVPARVELRVVTDAPACDVIEREPSAAASTTRPSEARARHLPADRGWRLTDRGIAVVLGLFVAFFVTAVVVAVGGFLSISDAPVGGVAAAAAVAGVLH